MFPAAQYIVPDVQDILPPAAIVVTQQIIPDTFPGSIIVQVRIIDVQIRIETDLYIVKSNLFTKVKFDPLR
jgi:hypothetical protein